MSALGDPVGLFRASVPRPPLAEVVPLPNGSAVGVRPIVLADTYRLRRLFERLSPTTIYHRFFTPVIRPRRRVLEHLAGVDHDRREALVAVVGDEIVGVARYDGRPGSPEAEVAVTVEDAWQGHGVGTALLVRLARRARDRGIAAFTASMLAENRQALGFLRRVSPEAEVQVHHGEYVVYAPLRRNAGRSARR
jgi:GNAT superfamily N-acetyltransferase